MIYNKNILHGWGVSKLESNLNDDKKRALKYIKTAKGQLEGIERMILEGRYCIDISNQLLASSALIRKAQKHILKQHLDHCVMNAINNDNEIDKAEKMEEITNLLDKILGGK